MLFVFQAEHQVAVRELLQQVGATLPLMAKEQLTFQAAGEESTEEQEALPNYSKMSIEISEAYVCLAREHHLDDPLDEQTTHGLMLQVFYYCHLLSTFP